MAICLAGWAEASITITPTYEDSGGETWTPERIAVFEQAIDDWESVLGAPLSEGSININVTVDFTTGQSYLGQWHGSWSGVYVGSSTRPWDKVTHVIHFNADRMDTNADNYLWFDPTPGDAGADQPFEVWDGVSLARHEIGHMLGITSSIYRDDIQLASDTDLWNSHITTGSSAVFDEGGLNVAMASVNNTGHVADSGATEGDLMVPALVNSVRREISDIDLQMLSMAYGYEIIPEPATVAMLPLGLFLIARRRRA